MKRKSLSKTTRFEVFKRDKFTCQYCGAKAPDVILHCDHIRPVADGGGNDVLNLVTACQACNGGKGARLLDDGSAVELQRAQLEALETRREQMQMMLQWRDELESIKTDTVELICDRIGQRGGGLEPNENGRSNIRRWLKRFEFDEILNAVDEAFDIYLRWSKDKPIDSSWELAFSRVPGICSVRRQATEKPYLQRLFYVQGILRNRFRDKRGRYVTALEEMILEWGADEQLLEDTAKVSDSWDEFNALVSSACYVASHRENANGEN